MCSTQKIIIIRIFFNRYCKINYSIVYLKSQKKTLMDNSNYASLMLP